MKKKQFSKTVCLMSWWLMALSVGANFVLAMYDKQVLSDMVMALISFVTVFINGGYITQNIFRDCSLNKHGIHLPADGDKHFIEKQEETSNVGTDNADNNQSFGFIDDSDTVSG